MVDFLLAIIIVLTLVLLIIVQGFKFVFGISRPYGPTSYYGNGYSDMQQHKSGSGVVFFIVLLLGGLAYLLIKNKEVQNPINFKASSIIPLTNGSLGHYNENALLNDKIDPPDKINHEERMNQNSSGSSIEEASILGDPYAEVYAIQIQAMSIKRFAEASANTLSETYDNLIKVRMPGSASYRIMIGPFESESLAVNFREVYDIKGYIKEIPQKYDSW